MEDGAVLEGGQDVFPERRRPFDLELWGRLVTQAFAGYRPPRMRIGDRPAPAWSACL